MQLMVMVKQAKDLNIHQNTNWVYQTGARCEDPSPAAVLVISTVWHAKLMSLDLLGQNYHGL